MKNKLLVISGGSKGIGKSIITKFVVNGFDIITCSRNSVDLDSLQTDIREISKNSSINCIKADLSVKSECNKFIDYINSFEKIPDILVNNVGTFVPGKIYNEKEGILEKMISTNLYSNYSVSRGVIPKMINQKRGHIFNICSVASKKAYKNGGSYCVSKFAFYGMSMCLREELKEYGIKVTSILPGATLTSSWDGTDLPEHRFIKPEDIAESVFSVFSMSKGANVEEIVIRPQKGDF